MVQGVRSSFVGQIEKERQLVAWCVSFFLRQSTKLQPLTFGFGCKNSRDLDWHHFILRAKNGADGLEPSSPQRLFPLATNEYTASPYEVSPDGKRVLLNRAEQTSELDVVVNWPFLLRKQAAQ
jgi:hypothetical protein